MTNQNQNPIIELALLCQKKFGSNIVTNVIDKYGEDHIPTIEVEVVLPNNKRFTATGSNQKIAKQKASIEALEYLKNGK